MELKTKTDRGGFIMSPDPEADAFVWGILRQPDDTTARLVFADWLDERGGPGNEAWARYIRAGVEAAKHAAWTIERNAQERILSAAVLELTAKLTVAVEVFVRYPRSLIQLLPPPNLAVRLAGHDIPRAIVELMPESVARECGVLPLMLQGNTLIVAATDACNVDTIHKLNFILNKETIAVGCDEAEMHEAINLYYGQTETESVDCVSYESPLVGLDDAPNASQTFGLFHTAFSRGATGFEMELVDEGRCWVSYHEGVRLVHVEFMPDAAFHHLLTHLKELPVESETIERGSRRLRLNIPLLSGRRFPVCVAVRRRWFRTRRFRVDFEWDR